MNRLESKQQNVEAELAEGEMLMKEEHVPAFLEGAVQSLQQHWHHTEELANQRYNMLKVNYHMEVRPPRPTNGISIEFEIQSKSECCSLKFPPLITMKFCTCHDRCMVVTCAKFRCDRSQPEQLKFWSNFEFNRNIVSARGA